jgi:hypothetical protein
MEEIFLSLIGVFLAFYQIYFCRRERKPKYKFIIIWFVILVFFIVCYSIRCYHIKLIKDHIVAYLCDTTGYDLTAARGYGTKVISELELNSHLAAVGFNKDLSQKAIVKMLKKLEMKTFDEHVYMEKFNRTTDFRLYFLSRQTSDEQYKKINKIN